MFRSKCQTAEKEIENSLIFLFITKVKHQGIFHQSDSNIKNKKQKKLPTPPTPSETYTTYTFTTNIVVIHVLCVSLKCINKLRAHLHQGMCYGVQNMHVLLCIAYMPRGALLQIITVLDFFIFFLNV